MYVLYDDDDDVHVIRNTPYLASTQASYTIGSGTTMRRNQLAAQLYVCINKYKLTCYKFKTIYYYVVCWTELYFKLFYNFMYKFLISYINIFVHCCVWQL